MISEALLIYGTVFSVFLTMLIFILAGKYIIIGLKVFYAKLVYKDNAGLVVFINKAGRILPPKVADLSKSTYKIKNKVYPLPTVITGNMFGLPFVFLNTDDVTKNAGIYYLVTDDNGDPVYYLDDNGEPIEDKDGNKMQKFNTLKQGAMFDAEFMKAVIMDQALTAAIKDLFAKHKNLLLFVMVAAGGSIAAAYFSYDFTQNQLPLLMSYAKTAASCAVVG